MEENIKKDLENLKDIRSHIKDANIIINNSNLELTATNHEYMKEVSNYLYGVIECLDLIITQKKSELADLEELLTGEDEDTEVEE